MKERILIVDDNQRNITLLGTILHKEDYQINIAMDGMQAIEMVKKAKPDLILLDVMMPILDGYDTCEQLKTNPDSAEIPVIFLTAKTQLEDRIKGFELGAVDYISKPFESRELLSRVRTHLELKQHKDLLKASNQRNLELLHMLCHDIANPLSLILGYLSLLKDVPEKFPKFQNVLNVAAENGLEVIEVARKMIDLDASGIELTTVALDKAVNKAISLAHRQFVQKEITIQAKLRPVHILCDEGSLINTVLYNILTNAIKFSNRGQSIVIDISEPNDKQVCLCIKDEGIGIPKHLLTKLFDINAKVNRQGTENETGTGFAMPLIKKFIEAYGGKLDVISLDIESNPNEHGTQFYFYFEKAKL